jgi:hypothetical protein
VKLHPVYVGALIANGARRAEGAMRAQRVHGSFFVYVTLAVGKFLRPAERKRNA